MYILHKKYKVYVPDEKQQYTKKRIIMCPHPAPNAHTHTHTHTHATHTQHPALTILPTITDP